MPPFIFCMLFIFWTCLIPQGHAENLLYGTRCMSSEGRMLAELPLQGGHVVCHSSVKITQAGQYVIDFKNTSTIAHFQHEVTDGHPPLVVLTGGIGREQSTPFLLRHGQHLALHPGTYDVITWLQSPYFLAQPEVFVTDLATYQQHTHRSTAISLLLLGVLLGMCGYYMVLGMMPGHVTERMYALFILGNLIFHSAALGLFNQLYQWSWFYLTSLPLLIANLAYISFVCHLLEIHPLLHRQLYHVSLVARMALLAAMVFAMIMPHWMLEMARWGVVMSLLFGLFCGVILSLQKRRMARLYLLAMTMMAVLSGLAIRTELLSTNVWSLEQLGLIATTLHVVVLSLLVAYHHHRLLNEKAQMLTELETTSALAMTDRLTGIPNLHALENHLLQLSEHDCLMFLDLDNLKQLNDQFGHEAGDQLLKHFSRTLNNQLDTHGKLYRLGGDEFAIICHQDDVEWCQHQLEYTHLQLKQDGMLCTGTSVGIVFAQEAKDRETLMRMAENRMYADKRSRKNRQDMVQAFIH